MELGIDHSSLNSPYPMSGEKGGDCMAISVEKSAEKTS